MFESGLLSALPFKPDPQADEGARSVTATLGDDSLATGARDRVRTQLRR